MTAIIWAAGDVALDQGYRGRSGNVADSGCILKSQLDLLMGWLRV